MMELNAFQTTGIVLTLLAMAFIGYRSGRNVHTAANFQSNSGKSNAIEVAGVVMGTLVGGTSTIGTAQLAFSFGLSAWWFTLGAGLGCLILALAYLRPLRRSGKTVLLQIISDQYGKGAGKLAGILCSLGMLVNIVAQMLSGTALLTMLLPISRAPAAALVAALMAAFVIFGGMLSAGIVGACKLGLIYISVIVAGGLVLHLSGGLGGMMKSLGAGLIGTRLGSLNSIADSVDVANTYRNLLARGALKDIGSGVSLILGVLSTQTYAQAVWSAKSTRAAARGVLLSAGMIPLVGLGGILVGLYMRAHYVTAQELLALGGTLPEGYTGVLEQSVQAFPAFIVEKLTGAGGSLLGGIILATLLIAVVGTGAGLALGASSVIGDALPARIAAHADNAKRLVLDRLLVALLLCLAALAALAVPGAVINDFSFLSMCLRAAVVFMPLTCSLWFPNRIGRIWIYACILGGPALVISGELLGLSIDPLLAGIALCAALCAAGALVNRLTRKERHSPSI